MASSLITTTPGSSQEQPDPLRDVKLPGRSTTVYTGAQHTTDVLMAVSGDHARPDEDGSSILPRPATAQSSKTLQIEHFTIDLSNDLLGKGGASKVYLGTDTNPHIPDYQVAIKIFDPSGGDKRFKERCQLESQFGGMLNHENILPVNDAGITPDGIAYIITRYYRGETWEEFFKADWSTRGPKNEHFSFSSASTTLFFENLFRVCDALEYAHWKRIIHRDIKPKNIFHDYSTGWPEREDRSRAPKVYVGDFGYAAFDGTDPMLERMPADIPTWAPSLRLTPTRAMAGTPLYMPPEHIIEEWNIPNLLPARPTTDVWSLGVTLYEYLTQRLPFGHETEDVREVFKAICRGRYRPMRSFNPHITPELEAAVQGALEKDPRGRTSSMKDFKDEVLTAFSQALKR